MKNIRQALLVAALAAPAISCGGSSSPSASPSGPTTATSQTATVVSGETGAVLGGVRVTASGTTYTTNAAGQVSLPATLTADSTIDIDVPGYLKRETTLARGPQFSLWPTQAQGATEAWTQQALHGTFGTSPMQRPDPQLTQYTIIPTAALANDSAALSALERAAVMWNAATANTGFTMRVGSGSPTNAFGVVVATIDASLTTAGGAAPLGTGRALSGGTISFRSTAAARLPNLIAHELGHMFGMAHSSDSVDIMFSASPPGDLSAREQMTARLMLQRRPGKVWPDNERAAGVQSQSGNRTAGLIWLCGL